MNTSKLSKSERLAVIRFCLHRGTHIKCSTHSLLRPLEVRYLEDAFNEFDAKHEKRYDGYRQEIEDYKNGKPLSQYFLMCFGSEGEPTVADLEDCLSKTIENAFDVRKSYGLSVDFEYLSDELLAFHNSMNPKITFGYSNQLHEECNCEITETVRNMLVTCFKDVKGIDDFLTFGGFMVGEITDEASPIYYEDLIVLRDDKELLSTMTHEDILTLHFSREDIDVFRFFEDSTMRNAKIIKKLQRVRKDCE